ncbi:MAG: hypothetical protein PWQ23_1935 [Thermoanaerobacter sp.]|nr:hypothetical protein [Thermoanaerobacter sp.]
MFVTGFIKGIEIDNLISIQDTVKEAKELSNGKNPKSTKM